MSDNLIISGIQEDFPKANTLASVQKFFREEMDLAHIPNNDILDCYRMGQPAEGKHRPIVIQCVPGLRQYILNNAAKLRGRTNAEGGGYYINPQLPDSLAEQRREIRQNIKQRKDQESAIGKADKSTFAIKNGKLFINGQIKRKTLVPPTVMDIFPDEKDQECVNAIKFKFLKKKQPVAGSDFKIALFRPKSIQQVRHAYIKLFQDHPSADHIAAAFSVGNDQDYQDNAEFGSGFRLLKCINQAKIDNIAIFMIRHHGGTNLGPRRFTIMMELAKAAISKFCPDEPHLTSNEMPDDPGNDQDQEHEENNNNRQSHDEEEASGYDSEQA